MERRKRFVKAFLVYKFEDVFEEDVSGEILFGMGLMLGYRMVLERFQSFLNHFFYFWISCQGRLENFLEVNFEDGRGCGMRNFIR